MRKSFIVFASLIALVMFVDNASAQVKFGAGYSMADHSLKYGDSDEGYALHGFNVGLTYDANAIQIHRIEVYAKDEQEQFIPLCEMGEEIL